MIRFTFATSHPIAKTPWTKEVPDLTDENLKIYKGQKFCGAEGVVTESSDGHGYVQIKEHPSQLWMHRSLIQQLKTHRVIGVNCFGAPLNNFGNLDDYTGAWCKEEGLMDYMLNITPAGPRELRVSLSIEGPLSKQNISILPLGTFLTIWSMLIVGKLELPGWERTIFSTLGGKPKQLLA